MSRPQPRRANPASCVNVTRYAPGRDAARSFQPCLPWAGQAIAATPLASSAAARPEGAATTLTMTSNPAQTRPTAPTAANTLRYPFTVLELSENTIPDPLPPQT